LSAEPVDCRYEAPRQKGDVEPVLSRNFVDSLFSRAQQVEQERCKPGIAQHSRNVSVPRAEPAASASVRKEHNAFRVGRNSESAFELRISRAKRDRSLEFVVIVRRH
jgi:hypothetical protein